MNKSKDKRGKQFLIVETGEIVYLNRIKESGQYFVDYQNGRYDSFWPNELKAIEKPKSKINNTSKPLSSIQTQNKAIRNDFFDEVAKDMPFNCMNCQKPLYAFTKWSKRFVSAHILPKALFTEIAENKDNIVFMGVDLIAGVCNCHTFYDANIDNRVSMNIYPLVLKRFNDNLKPLLTSDKIIEAWEYLGIKYTSQMLKELK